MTRQMKAARLPAYGDADMFQVDDVVVPAPGDDEILIRVEASAVNPFDLILRQGFVAEHVPLPLPAVLGTDVAGTVVRTGKEVQGLSPGDRVVADLPHNGRGGHAEFAVVPAGTWARLPENLSFAQGATLPKAGLMGRQAALALGVRKGDRVLVTGALGAVGRSAVQYLRELGAVPVAGVRPARVAEAMQLGVATQDLAAVPVTAEFDHAISTASDATAIAMSHVRNGGKVAAIARVPDGTSIPIGVSVIELYHRTDATMLADVVAAASRGALQIPIAGMFRLEQLPDAHRAVAAGTKGKVLVVP